MQLQQPHASPPTGKFLHLCLTYEAGSQALISFLFIHAGDPHLGQGGMLVLVVLYDGVGDAGQHQDAQQDVEFILQAQEGAVGEGDDEAQGLPHAVVGKRCFFVSWEKDPVQSCRTHVSRGLRLLASLGSVLYTPDLLLTVNKHRFYLIHHNVSQM